ncbi:MAG: transglutaminase-like domain-containing protein [Clostridiales bacterium]
MINIVTLLIFIVFVIPIISGVLEPFIRERFRIYLGSIIYNVEFILALLLSIYFTNEIFFTQKYSFYKTIYNLLPKNFTNALIGKDIFIYIISVPILLIIITLFLRLITNPLYNIIIIPIADNVYNFLKSFKRPVKKVVNGVLGIPKAVFYVILICLALKFYSYYLPHPIVTKWLNNSLTYQFVCNATLNPILNTNMAKQVPVIVNDSFKSTFNDPDVPISDQIKESINKKNIQVIEYFNGVTLDEAIESTPEIDSTAKEIISNSKSSKKKASLLYDWISSNLTYDYDKAAKISESPDGISSGAKVAFSTRTGICFDYSTLYIAMCRAVGVKVRLVTGLGYSGLSWGDHAWNQIYNEEEDKWINVDTTFGSTAGNYFDKEDFDVDHQFPEVQDEW